MQLLSMRLDISLAVCLDYVNNQLIVAYKGSGQNYYTRTGPTKPQNSWWCLPAPPLLNVKRWCLYCIATPLSSSKKLQ